MVGSVRVVKSRAVMSVIGTLVFVVGGATAMTAGLLPLAVIIEAIGGSHPRPLLIVMVVFIATLLIGAALRGKRLRHLPWGRCFSSRAGGLGRAIGGVQVNTAASCVRVEMSSFW